jgi:hypothetical protein
MVGKRAGARWRAVGQSVIGENLLQTGLVDRPEELNRGPYFRVFT